MSKEKSLKDKAVKIQGKDYVLVADRVLYFNETYPKGSIVTDLLSDTQAETIVMRATVTPDTDNPSRIFTGYAQEVIGQGFINKTSALENAETSCVGRALAMMGIGVIDSIASVDEITKAKNRTVAPKTLSKTKLNDQTEEPFGKKDDEQMYVNMYKNPKSEAQKKFAKMKLKELGHDFDDLEIDQYKSTE